MCAAPSRRRSRSSRRQTDPPGKPTAPSPPRASAGVLAACLFVSGATGLVYEVVWLRMLGLIFGHTVYAITATLAAFMGGLGLGSYLFGRRAAGFANPIRTHRAPE